VLPNTNNDPSLLPEDRVHDTVPRLVRGDLFFPEDGIGFGLGAVPRTPVLKAAIHKYGNLVFWKDEVWFAVNRPVPPPPFQFHVAEHGNEGSLGFLVFMGTDSGHDLGPLLL
jgi:hypothetical protein